MVKKPTAQMPQEARLSPQEMTSGIERLKRRLADIDKFDPRSVTDQHSHPELDALRVSIDEALVRTFGGNTLDYKRYKSAANFDCGPYNYARRLQPDEFQPTIAKSKASSLALIGQAIRSLEEQLAESSAVAPSNYASLRPVPTRKVFVVHGRDNETKNEVARFLSKIGLEEIILHERPNGGRHLLTKFQEESEGASFAVILMTPDDEGAIVGQPAQKRARQNVVFELGFFVGKLGVGRVAALMKGDIEKPSDFDGVGYILLDAAGAWKSSLARELHHANVPFDPQKVFAT